MPPRQPTTIAQVRQLAQQMANNPADAVALGSQLGSLIRDLPPDRATLLSRPHFERASLWTYGVSFENVEVASASEAPPQIIRIQTDLWLRGIEAQVILKHADNDSLEFFGLASATRYGANNRAWIEANWRVDARQGFVSDGQSEILQDALSITGDGQFSAPIDWKLQKDQTIEVRLRSKLSELFGPLVQEEGAFANMQMRWVVITFWGEALRQAGVQ